MVPALHRPHSQISVSFLKAFAGYAPAFTAGVATRAGRGSYTL